MVLVAAAENSTISAEAARAARDDIVEGHYGWDLFIWAIRRHLVVR